MNFKKTILKSAVLGLSLILLSNITFSQILNGQFYVPPYPVPNLYYSENVPELPAQVLNYNLPYFPQQFYDQGSVPSCGQASAIYYCLTYEYNRLKNTPADSTSTFAPLYTYFFLDYGDNWYGASSFDSWNIVKNQGNPFVNDFPEYLIDEQYDFDRLPVWMNGYDKYYRSMKNRISGYYSLDVKTDEDLKILQHYLHDHLRQESSGGSAIVYCSPKNYGISTDTVFNNWWITFVYSLESYMTHSLTLVGYYQNTTRDFNNDGMITDSLDINEDGNIDFHDNEKILWVLANSADNTSSWNSSTSIFVFKYDLLSECFNGQVFLPVPDTTYQPELTAKIRISHPLRGLLKISAGISSDINSDVPEYSIDLPIFNFQGGFLNMQGDDTVPNSETIEIGLDISELLKFPENDGISKVFLTVDNAAFLNGSLDYFSVIRYDQEIPSEYIAVIEDSLLPAKRTTRFSVNLPIHSRFDENILRIESESLYSFSDGDTLQAVITASGGTPPYTFYKYREDEYSQQLSSEPYVIDYFENTTPKNDSLFVADPSVIFAGETFDTLIIGKKGNILFRTEEPSYSKLYPYQYYSEIPLFDMEIKNYYPGKIDFWRRFRIDDTCVNFYHSQSARIKTSINNTGVISLGYTSIANDWYHSSYLKTRCYTYFSDLLPYSYNSDFKSAIFYPVPDESGINISGDGTISLNSNLQSGNYKTNVLLVDSKGDKSVKLINFEISGNRDELVENIGLVSVFPNPAKDVIFVEFKSSKSQDVVVEITNSLGQVVFSEKHACVPGKNTYMIPLDKSGIDCGYYIGSIKYQNKNDRFRFVVIN